MAALSASRTTGDGQLVQETEQLTSTTRAGQIEMPPFTTSCISININGRTAPHHQTGTTASRPLTIAYYCSGHGYGHATRVSALSDDLLSRAHTVHISTNAPEHVFTASIARGAIYRHALIDAGIVQPKAYDVARRETVDGLEKFLRERPRRLEEEVAWLKKIKADVVLVDAPFLPCAAAAKAGIPSIVVSNFTFDSCYSYLSVSTEADHRSTSLDGEATHDNPEPPIAVEILQPLVNRVIQDYANASLLLRLPGAIPIPAFDTDVPLPASQWTDIEAHSFNSQITALLDRDPASIPCDSPEASRTRRKVIDTPLIARPLSADVYTAEKRRQILQSVGVPEHLQDANTTRILLVSFGGQSIPRPASRSPSPAPSPARTRQNSLSAGHPAPTVLQEVSDHDRPPSTSHLAPPTRPAMQRIMTSQHVYLPGAPPALHFEGTASDLTAANDALATQSSTTADGLLPPGWIAVVCGLANGQGEEALPEGFYAAPRDIYVPDLTATCDVVLGKLGYGTCSETVSTQTPFLYVPRPLFVEEFGLKRLMEQRGISLAISRSDFEAGNWSQHITAVYEAGKGKKEQHRLDFTEDPTKRTSAASFIAAEIEQFMADYDTNNDTN